MPYDPNSPLDARMGKAITVLDAANLLDLVDKAVEKISFMDDDPAIEALTSGDHPHLQVEFDEERENEAITVSITIGTHILRVARPDGPLMPTTILDRLDAARSTIALLRRCIGMCVSRGLDDKDNGVLWSSRDPDETSRLDHIALAIRTLAGDEGLDIVTPRSPWGPATIEGADDGETLTGFDEVMGPRMTPFVWVRHDATQAVTTVRLIAGERFIPFDEMSVIDAMRFIVDEGITEADMALMGIAPGVPA